MLCRIFLKLAGMSVTAGVLVLAILAVRALTRRRMPKWAHCLLWGLVAACLLCPVLPESGLSLRPQSGELVRYGDQLTGLDREPVIILMETGVQDVYAFRTGEADRPGVSLMPLAYVWLAGMAVLLGWAAFSWLRLRRQVAASVNVAKGVYICDDIASPFILGVLHPRIYLPSGLTGATLESVLRHERAHLKRRDHWWKPLAHVLIAVYWFNPLLWAAYVLLCRDIELACDERVVRDYDPGGPGRLFPGPAAMQPEPAAQTGAVPPGLWRGRRADPGKVGAALSPSGGVAVGCGGSAVRRPGGDVPHGAQDRGERSGGKGPDA